MKTARKTSSYQRNEASKLMDKIMEIVSPLSDDSYCSLMQDLIHKIREEGKPSPVKTARQRLRLIRLRRNAESKRPYLKGLGRR